MLTIWILMLIFVLLYNLVRGTRFLRAYAREEKDFTANALASHAVFETNKKYPFESGKRTATQEFWRRYYKRKDLGGEMTQHVVNDIASDVASEVRSFRSVSVDRNRKKIF